MKKILFVVLILVATMVTTVFARALYDTPYIGNAYRRTFHYRECPSVDQMMEKNQVPLATRQEAIDKGFRPCKNCNP